MKIVVSEEMKDLLDSDRVLGPVGVELEDGDVQLGEPSQAVCVNVANLERVLKMVRLVGWRYVYVRVQKETPLVLQQSRNSKVGYAVAPFAEGGV